MTQWPEPWLSIIILSTRWFRRWLFCSNFGILTLTLNIFHGGFLSLPVILSLSSTEKSAKSLLLMQHFWLMRTNETNIRVNGSNGFYSIQFRTKKINRMSYVSVVCCGWRNVRGIGCVHSRSESLHLSCQCHVCHVCVMWVIYPSIDCCHPILEVYPNSSSCWSHHRKLCGGADLSENCVDPSIGPSHFGAVVSTSGRLLLRFQSRVYPCLSVSRLLASLPAWIWRNQSVSSSCHHLQLVSCCPSYYLCTWLTQVIWSG